MFASSWVLLNVVSYSIHSKTQIQQVNIAERLRQDSIYWVMFPVVISQNVDRLSVVTFLAARQELPNNWVFLVVEIFSAGQLLRTSFLYVALIRPMTQGKPIGRTDVSDDPCNACMTT